MGNLEGVEELGRNLSRIKNLTHDALITGLEISANNVVTHAKLRHTFGKSLDPATVSEHPDKRFYTWTSNLVNSIRAGNVEQYPNGLLIEVTAGAGLGIYPQLVEYGGPGRREFPFMRPAMSGTAKLNLSILGKAVRSVLGG